MKKSTSTSRNVRAASLATKKVRPHPPPPVAPVMPPGITPDLLEKLSLRGPIARSGAPTHLHSREIEKALTTGEHRPTLEGYFGAVEYAELVHLAKTKGKRGGARVLILPGILGSLLARTDRGKSDKLWIDYFDIIRGRLRELKMPDDGKSFAAIDAHPATYLGLKLWLRSQGFDADFHPFDWRQSIPDLGRELAARIQADPASEVFLVAHSMGGLVARAALFSQPDLLPKVRRLVMLGTPNFGSFAPVLVYRGVYRFLKLLALLDLAHGAHELGGKILNTLPGLMEMMPHRSKFSTVNLYEPAGWPTKGGRPDPRFLPHVTAAQQKLAVDPERFVLIAGVDQETTVGVAKVGDEFVFDRSKDGDGTVPLDLAMIPGVPTYYCADGHGELPKNKSVFRAVADILTKGSTTELRTDWPRHRANWQRKVTESQLDIELESALRGSRDRLSVDELRSCIEEFAAGASRAGSAPAPEDSAAPEAAPPAPTTGALVMGRRTQRRIEVRLVRGSITQVRSRAYILGAFQGVAPSGAALAIDELMDHAITEFRQRRMFTHAVGELIVLPAASHDVRTDQVIFLGMGPIDRFDADVLRTAADNAARSLVRSKIDEFATVLMGAGTGLDTRAALEAILSGFFAGLRDADRWHEFRAVTFCEQDAARHDALYDALVQLATTELCDGVEFTIIKLPTPEPPVVAVAARRTGRAMPPSVYMNVRATTGTGADIQVFETALLTSGPKATVLADTIAVDKARLRAQLERIETRAFRHDALPVFGRDLAALVLPESIRTALHTYIDHHLVVIHDAEASRLPWETIAVNGAFPALSGGISRRYVADQLAVGKWLEQRRGAPTLTALLVVNPTQDLDGAQVEGERLKEVFAGIPNTRIVTITGAEATRTRLISEFKSGAYDILHYAGHAFFDPVRPSRSGIICAREEILCGSDLAAVANLPALVFFNACESGRVRKRVRTKNPHLTRSIHERLERNSGLAESFLRGGVGNYIGTYWPVNDDSATLFSETFYTDLLQTKTIGEALDHARARLNDQRMHDWADYIFYGSYDFQLKCEPSGAAG